MTYTVWGNPAYKYGNSSRLWGDGTPATDPVIYWSIQVDWANTGTYTGANEAQYCIDMEIKRGRTNRLNIGSEGVADGIALPMIGSARLVFDNTTRRFDPYYTSGDLYGNLLPGRYIKIRVTYHGVTYPVFHGNIRTIDPQDGENPVVIIECEDGMRQIQGADTNIGVQTDLNIKHAVVQILDDIDWPDRFGHFTATTSADDTLYYILPYFWTEGTAKKNIQDLCNAYAGNFWIDESGTAQFAHFGIVTNVSALTIEESNTLKQISLPVPWENIKNSQRFYYHAYAAQTTGTLWTQVDITEVGIGESVTFWGEYSYNNELCPAINIISPTATTDYTMNTLADGTGTDLTASFSVSLTDFGSKAKLVVTNNSASIGFITLLKIRGDAVASNNDSFVTYEDAASIANFGRKYLRMDSKFIQKQKTAARHPVYTINIASNDPCIQVQMDTRPDEQFRAELFRGVPVDIAKFGINEDRQFGYIEHKWTSPNGQRVLSTFILENIR